MSDGSCVKFNKDTHTILIPNLFPIHMDFLVDALDSQGYRAEVLKTSGREVLDAGLKYVHNDMCYPAICSVGQQLYAITSGQYDPHKVALLQFQTGGGCRASNYAMLLQKALEKMKMEYIPVITIGFSAALQNRNSIKFTPKLCTKALAALTYGDMLMLLKNQVRPYEVNEGETLEMVAHWSKIISAELKSKSAAVSRLKKNLLSMVKDFAQIQVKHTQKVKVGIVGEIYVKYSPFGNNELESFLDSQDCEYMLPGVLGFVHYCLSNTDVDYQLYGGNYVKRGVGLLLEKAIDIYESILKSAVEKCPKFIAPVSFHQMKENGAKGLHRGVKMGEGWFLPAEMVELIEHGYSNIICTQPFGCLPNHIVGKGIIRRFYDIYPQANICPIDYDANASAVNQENRLKLMLAVAKDKFNACPEGNPVSV